MPVTSIRPTIGETPKTDAEDDEASYLDVAFGETVARQEVGASDAYLEPSDGPDEASGVAPARRKVRAQDRGTAAPDASWNLVVNALVAGRPLLVALWPGDDGAHLLRATPPTSTIKLRCEETMRAIDAVGRRDGSSRALAEVAQRNLQRQFADFSPDVDAWRRRVIAELEESQVARMLEIARILAGSGMAFSPSDAALLDEVAEACGIDRVRARDILRATGIEFQEGVPRPEPARSAPTVEASADPPKDKVDDPAPFRRSVSGRRIDPSWHFEHLGADYFLPIVLAHRAARLPPLSAIWTGRTGVAYVEKARGRQVNPNWMIELDGGETYTRRGGLAVPDAYNRSQMHRWEMAELIERFGSLSSTSAARAPGPAASATPAGETVAQAMLKNARAALAEERAPREKGVPGDTFARPTPQPAGRAVSAQDRPEAPQDPTAPTGKPAMRATEAPPRPRAVATGSGSSEQPRSPGPSSEENHPVRAAKVSPGEPPRDSPAIDRSPSESFLGPGVLIILACLVLVLALPCLMAVVG